MDKILLIKEIIDSGDKIFLIPRSRRFGKTLNLSMLGYFYDCCPLTWEPDSNTQPPAPGKETHPPEIHFRFWFPFRPARAAHHEYYHLPDYEKFRRKKLTDYKK